MNGTVQGADLSLSRDQEQLLRNALASNPKGSTGDVGTIKRPSSTIVGNGAGIYSSPPEEAPGSGTLGVDDSPFLDYELEDGQFDWDNSQDNLFPDLPGMDSAEGDHHDKRKASIDSDGLETGASKRREGEEKTAKKPGRKPLTAEPTTVSFSASLSFVLILRFLTQKRKAQNRAAQRAFRERKERHLKDLETKVDDLEKASEATNHENGRLRAQVEKLNIELREYRKRVSLIGSAPTASPPLANSQNRGSQSSNEFQFAFPKFGDLPSSFMSNGSMAKTSTTSPTSQNPGTVSNPNLPYFGRTNSTGSAAVSSPTGNQGPQSATDNSFISNNITFSSSDLQDLTGLFSPAVLESASRSNSTDYISFKGGKSASPSVRHGSTSTVNGNSPMPKTQRNSSTSMTASPISSVSQNGLDSSCGTTPESTCESPDNSKAAEPTLNTISEETAGPHKPEGKASFLYISRVHRSTSTRLPCSPNTRLTFHSRSCGRPQITEYGN